MPGRLNLCIDAGHGGDDKGCQYNGIVESDYNWTIFHDLTHCIASSNLSNHVNIICSRLANETVSLKERSRISNESSAKMYLSLHVNAASVTSLEGSMCFNYPGSNVARRIAYAIATRQPFELSRRMNNVFPAKNLPISDKDDWLQRPEEVLKRPSAEWKVLVEMGYASNPENAEYLKTEIGQASLVSSLMSGICEAVRFHQLGWT